MAFTSGVLEHVHKLLSVVHIVAQEGGHHLKFCELPFVEGCGLEEHPHSFATIGSTASLILPDLGDLTQGPFMDVALVQVATCQQLHLVGVQLLKGETFLLLERLVGHLDEELQDLRCCFRVLAGNLLEDAREVLQVVVAIVCHHRVDHQHEIRPQGGL